MSQKSPAMSQFRIFVDRIDRLRRGRDDRRLVLIDFRQTPFASSGIQTRMAMHLVEAGFREQDGETYRIAEWFLACITEPRNEALLRELMQSVLAMSTEWDETIGEAFLNSIDVVRQPRRIEALLVTTSAAVEEGDAAAAAAENSRKVPAAGIRGQATTREIADPTHFSPLVQLDLIESQLAKLRFHEYLRAQPICRITDGAVRAIVGQELFTSIGELQKRFATSIDMAEQYLLRHHLSQRLDQCVIAQFDPGRPLDGTVAVHINVLLSTLRSPSFHNFDAMLGDRRRDVTLEIAISDAVAHVSDYQSMVPTLRERGYSVAIDGLSAQSLATTVVERLPADVVKLIWRGDVAISAASRTRLAALKTNGVRVVLCRCDRKTAFTWGANEGIDYYQGAAVDGMAATILSATCTAVNKQDCSSNKCHSMHWTIHHKGTVRCPTPMWVNRRPRPSAAANGSVAGQRKPS